MTISNLFTVCVAPVISEAFSLIKHTLWLQANGLWMGNVKSDKEVEETVRGRGGEDQDMQKGGGS